MKTYTPDLDPAVLDRLRGYAAQFADDFLQAKPAAWAGVYLQGLLLDGDRKSVEPLSRRVPLPGRQAAGRAGMRFGGQAVGLFVQLQPAEDGRAGDAKDAGDGRWRFAVLDGLNRLPAS